MNYNIFIWKSYGIIEVYSIDAIEKIGKLFSTIFDSALNYVDYMYLSKVEDYITGNKESIPRYIKAINYILDEFDIGSHEAFEHGTGFGELK